MNTLKKQAQELASYGRNGDTMLAHITPEEAAMLKAAGGSGTTNPDTGLPEFFIPALIGAGIGLLGSKMAGDSAESAARKQSKAQLEAARIAAEDRPRWPPTRATTPRPPQRPRAGDAGVCAPAGCRWRERSRGRDHAPA